MTKLCARKPKVNIVSPGGRRTPPGVIVVRIDVCEQDDDFILRCWYSLKSWIGISIRIDGEVAHDLAEILALLVDRRQVPGPPVSMERRGLSGHRTIEERSRPPKPRGGARPGAGRKKLK